MTTPDVTSMQKIVGALTVVITAGLSLAAAFGAGLSVEQDTKILALWAALGSFAVTADAIIRHGRSTTAAAKHAADAVVAAANATASRPKRAPAKKKAATVAAAPAAPTPPAP